MSFFGERDFVVEYRLDVCKSHHEILRDIVVIEFQVVKKIILSL